MGRTGGYGGGGGVQSVNYFCCCYYYEFLSLQESLVQNFPRSLAGSWAPPPAAESMPPSPSLLPPTAPRPPSSGAREPGRQVTKPCAGRERKEVLGGRSKASPEKSRQLSVFCSAAGSEELKLPVNIYMVASQR